MSPPRRPLPPQDPRLPGLALLDQDRLVEALSSVLGLSHHVEEARVGYLELAPRTSLVLRVDAVVDGQERTAVLRSGAAATGRFGCGAPVAGLDTVVHWLPEDPSLPLLAAATGTLEVHVLSYVPGRRATLGIAPYVLKTYATTPGYQAARAALDLLGDGRDLPTPPFVAVLPEHRTAVQEHVTGVPATLADTVALAPQAGALLRRLHSSDRRSTARRDPADQLREARRSVELVASVLPEQGARAADLLRRLSTRIPSAGPLVLSHGDFTVDQLVVGSAGLVVTDVDDACQAPAALDLAAFAANVVSGRPGDDEHGDRVLDALLEGYGTPPPALAWHHAVALLRRCDRPFRRWKKHWPQKSTAILDLVEQKVSTSCA